MDKIIMILQFIVGLLFIVGIHELGHFLLARLFKIRVESYGIGLPPKIFTKKIKETEYYIGSIPLGGAVKLSGMIDECMDESFQESVPKPYEYRSKPAWQRLVVILAGIFFNIVTGIFIYSALSWYTGRDYLSKDEVNKIGILPNEIGIRLGFQEGDKIIKINGEDFEEFADIFVSAKNLEKDTYYTVERNGEEISVKIPIELKERFLHQEYNQPFLLPLLPPIVGKIFPNGGAAESNLKEGDRILELNGIKIEFYHQMQKELQGNAGKIIKLKYKRAEEIFSTNISVNHIGQIGIEIATPIIYAHKNYGLVDSIKEGALRSYNIVALNFIGLKKLFTGKVSASKALSGHIGIAKNFGGTFNVINFCNIVGFLSLAIAIMNLLPIPAMDGGHAVLIFYEIITGRKISSKIIIIIQKIGIALLLGLAIYTTINDIYKIFI